MGLFKIVDTLGWKEFFSGLNEFVDSLKEWRFYLVYSHKVQLQGTDNFSACQSVSHPCTQAPVSFLTNCNHLIVATGYPWYFDLNFLLSFGSGCNIVKTLWYWKKSACVAFLILSQIPLAGHWVKVLQNFIFSLLSMILYTIW